MRLLECAVCIIFGCIAKSALSQDFIGCGGFIRSDVEIDFTLIRVRLYTKQGSIKDDAECAPNNGYYMIPVYEKGEYVLQVEPPSGWGLTPLRVPLTIDGSTDPCSKGEDIDFRFTGFGLVGRVVSSSSESGPAGVQVVLKDAAGVLQQSASTTDGGRYIFANVLPGRYVVEARHPFWRFEKAAAEVEVSKVTGDAGSSIVVHGYDVTGRIESEGEPVQGVTFLLFSDTDASPRVYGCSDATDAETESGKRKALCQVTSDDRGLFTFQSVPVGKYNVVPIYKGQLTSFEVRPSKEAFTVGHESFSFAQPFLVTGFTVRGVVRSTAKGAAIAGAKVFVDGAHVATADSNGSFELSGIKSGTYTVSASAEHMHFGESRHKVTPSAPVFPDVVPDRFDICGQIVLTSEGTGSTLRSLRSYPEDDPSRVTIVSANKDGTFCISATIGVRIVIEPIVSDAEKRAGLRLAPERRVESVTDRPIAGLVFSQFLATVTGSVSCLESCPSTTVVLQSTEKAEILRSTKLLVDGDNKGTFTFDGITPGRYKANILLDSWCWDPAHIEINVEKKVETVAFAHIGYKLSIDSSHEVTVVYTGEGVLANVTASLNVHRGLSHFCLPAKGAYVITPPEAFCHRFEKDQYSCDTKDSPNFINMKAVLHRVDGEVILDDHAADVVVTVEIDESEPQVTGPLQVTKEGDAFVAHFNFFAKEGKRVRLTATAAEMLFRPSSVEATVSSESCPAALVTISGHKGVFFRGKVTPAVLGVTVSIVANDGSVTAKALTDADGTYSIGPLAKVKDGYVVQAERSGYVLTAVAGAEHDFVARKLSEVAVEVVDGTDQPLGGVLLSLTGGSAYKNNNLTHETGRFSFVGLAPGRYFLRPLMKEYQFQPPSQFVDVSEGQLVPVRLVGARTAFSCYGKMTSVHGEPEPSATVEAVGLDDCSKYAEEARTESDGTFRIRGLKPTCRYRLTLKNGSSPDSWIDRIVPEGQIIEVKDADVNAGLLLAFHPRVHTDVCLFIRTKEEHLSSIRLKLYRFDGRDETLLQVVSPSQSSIVFFNLLQKSGQRHVVRLESTLPPSLYDYGASEVSFVADAASKHLSIDFVPRLRPSPQDASAGGSLAALALVIVSFVVFYNYQQVVNISQQALLRLTGQRPATVTAATASYRSVAQSRSSGRQTVVAATAPATPPAGAVGELSDDLDWQTEKKEKKLKPRRA